MSMSPTGLTTPGKAPTQCWIGLGVIALPCILVSMDMTVLNLAVPHLAAALSPSAGQLLWIVDIYGFMVAGALMTMGTLGDRFGRRRLLLIGAAFFGIASAVAAFATSPVQLIVARALLGLSAATLAPSTLSLIRNMFEDEDERRIAIGVWIASFSAGAAIGPVVGGLLLEHFWWGSVFLVNVLIMIVLLTLGPLLLPEYRDPNAGRLDVVSAGQSLVAALSVVWGLKRLAEHGPDASAAATIVAGLALAAVFLRRQRRLADPIVDLALFRSPAFSIALAVNLAGFFFMFSIFFFVPQYLQLVVGLSPLEAGLWTLPSGIAFIAGSLLSPAIAAKLQAERVLIAALVVAAAGFAVLTQVDAAGSLAVAVIGSVIFSLGLTPVITLTTDIVVGAAPPERAGSAAALSETSNEAGGTLGIAVLGSIAMSVYRGAMAGEPAAALSEAAQATIGGAVAAAETLQPKEAEALVSAARDAFTAGMQLTAGISVLGLLATAALAAMLLRRMRSSPSCQEA
ncbi:MFS transporter [Mesorhizobium sp. NPDC059054]|uniref:MFS transporter n=1 Tax=Mesorhizobium sp. NPDC059054 TaxID=3346711 RepID=UPI0036AE4F68